MREFIRTLKMNQSIPNYMETGYYLHIYFLIIMRIIYDDQKTEICININPKDMIYI